MLALEPFDRLLDGKDGDLAMAGNFIDPALKRSPGLQVYVDQIHFNNVGSYVVGRENNLIICV